MKILHTSDWHLGNVFHGNQRTEEHRHFLNWLLSTLQQERPDALLVSGDVFDSSNPPASAQTLLYDFLTQATEQLPGLQVVLTAGNHDSPWRLEAPAFLLRRHEVYVRGVVRQREQARQAEPELASELSALTERATQTEQGEQGEAGGCLPDFGHYVLPLHELGSAEAKAVVFALPYLRPGDVAGARRTGSESDGSEQAALRVCFEGMHKWLRRSDFAGLPVVCMAHFFAAGAAVAEGEHSERLVVGGAEQVEAAVVGGGVSYTALGHLHRRQKVGGDPTVRYAGSALPMSFTERDYRHGALLVELDAGTGQASVRELDYEPLRALRTLPERGAALPEELPALIASLPKRRRADQGLDWPYLELRVQESEPQPELLHQVTQMLQERAARLCRMVRCSPQGARQEQAQPGRSLEELRQTSPLELARELWQTRYKAEMPQELVCRFQRAEQKAREQEATCEE